MDAEHPDWSSPHPPVEPDQERRRGWRLLLAALLVLVVGYFLGRSIWVNWGTIRSYAWHLDGIWLLVSAALAWLAFALLVGLWRILLVATSGQGIHYGTTYRISALANFGKYIPGKVWSVMGLVWFLRREGYPVPSAIGATMLHQAYTLIAGGIFVGVVLGAEFWGRLPLVPVVLGLGLGVIVLYPPLFARIINLGLGLIGREPIRIRLPFARVLLLFVGYVAAWVAYGSVLWSLLHGIGLEPGKFWEIVAAFGAAYLIGFIALFAPGGIGVREGILTLLLTPHLGAGVAALVAVTARLWLMLVELLQLSPLLAVRKRAPRP